MVDLTNNSFQPGSVHGAYTRDEAVTRHQRAVLVWQHFRRTKGEEAGIDPVRGSHVVVPNVLPDDKPRDYVLPPEGAVLPAGPLPEGGMDGGMQLHPKPWFHQDRLPDVLIFETAPTRHPLTGAVQVAVTWDGQDIETLTYSLPATPDAAVPQPA